MPTDRRTSTLLVLVLALLALPRLSVAGGFGVPEMGTRRTGMAAVVGRPDDPSAVYHNPAGLTLLPRTHLYASLGLSLIGSEFRLRPWKGSELFLDAPVDAEGYYPATEPTRAFGVIPMLVGTHEVLADRLWAALSVYVSNATGSKFDEDAVTRYHLIDGYVVSPLAALSSAVKVLDWLSIGAGVGLMNIRIYGRRHFYPMVPVDPSDPDSMMLNVSAGFGTKSELELEGTDWLATWNAGVLVQPTRRLSLGATVIGRARPELEGDVTLTYDETVEPGGTLEGTHRTGMLVPWTFMLGASWDALRHLEVAGELRYWVYSEYDEQRIDVEGIALVEQIVAPKDYHDSWQLSGGVRVHGLSFAPRLEMMLGGHFDRTPAPPSTVSLDQPTFSHAGAHTGLRARLGERLRVGLTYIHYFYFVPRIDDSRTMPPSNVRGGLAHNNIFTVTFEAELGSGPER